MFYTVNKELYYKPRREDLKRYLPVMAYVVVGAVIGACIGAYVFMMTMPVDGEPNVIYLKSK